jgi:hypothetical protein
MNLYRLTLHSARKSQTDKRQGLAKFAKTAVGSIGWKTGVKRGPVRTASRGLAAFAASCAIDGSSTLDRALRRTCGPRISLAFLERAREHPLRFSTSRALSYWENDPEAGRV